MIKILFIALGSFFVVLGVLGIVLPGLPTTPFLLLAGICYARGSRKFHNWLNQHRILGKYIREYNETRSLTIKTKVIALSMMGTMICISIFLILTSLYLQISIAMAGLVGAIVILKIPTTARSKATSQGEHATAMRRPKI